MFNNFIWLLPVGSGLALLFAVYFAYFVLRHSEGTDEMKKIAQAVREGSMAFIKRQNKTIIICFITVFFILLLLALQNYLTIFVPFAFLSGGFFSGLAGIFGMMIATRASSRTTNAAKNSLNEGLKVAFASGTVMGLAVVGLGLLHLTIWYFLLNWYYKGNLNLVIAPILCSGMGASFFALFARVGGGIFTKSADVGADLVGKIEAGIPEDDPRNPAVIADNVGDNVGDVCGMGADLYESYIGSIIATMSLALFAGLGIKGVILPLLIAVVGVLSSIVGVFFVRIKKENKGMGVLLWALRKGVFSSSILIAIISLLVILKVLGTSYLGLYWAILSGLVAGIVIGLSTEYYTSANYSPTRKVAETATGGTATLILGGLSTGMVSTVIPVVTIGIAIIISFYLSGGNSIASLGLYGIGLASVGMLSTLGITLATDSYGPVADNAGGNAEMTHQEPYVRERTDALDSLGNTTAATGKGFAIGSAALTTLALISTYKEQIKALGVNLDISIMNPKLLVGLLIGGMIPFVFCSMLMQAVGRAAQKIVQEVRRQFREIVGLMEGKTKADYAHCVDICTIAAQKEVILPSLMAIVVPPVIGLLLGPDAIIGLLAGALVSGFVLAIMMANAGGTWDNAKKHIESGKHGGKGSANHKSAVVGDTVGDPFKDTAGPSLNILIKLMSIVSVVFATFIVKNTLFK